MVDGVIGILTGRGPACDELQAWLETLQPYPLDHVLRIPGNQIAHQRNLVADHMMTQGLPYVLYVDADCVPPPGALSRLLGHGLPLVSGTCVERNAPYDLCAVANFEPYRRYKVEDLEGREEPFPVVSAGTGCLLVRREVFEAMTPPYFRCGQISADLLAEDLDFCLRAAEAGFPIYLDPLVLVGHEVRMLMYPGGDGQLWARCFGPFGALPYKVPLGTEIASELHV
jgi:hypothetical protein